MCPFRFLNYSGNFLTEGKAMLVIPGVCFFLKYHAFVFYV